MMPSRTASSRTRTSTATVFLTVERPYSVSQRSMARSIKPCVYKEKAELVGGQPDRLGLVRHLGPADRGGGGVGEHLGVVDAVVVEPGQRGQLPRHRGRRGGPAGPRLG